MPWIATTEELADCPSRVVVAGTSGSGKSAFARGIAETLGIPYFEIDALYHGPNWTPNPGFIDAVESRIAGPAWVTEWQYSQVRDRLADRANLLVWLDLPRHVVMSSVVRRTVRRSFFGVELWNGNREPPLRSILTDRDHIIRWAWRTHGELPARVRACVARRPWLIAMAVHSRRDGAAWLAGPLGRARHAP